MGTSPYVWRSTVVAKGLITLGVICLAAACGSATESSQNGLTQPAASSEEQFNEYFDANYANVTVKDLQDRNFTPEGDCVTKDSISLADSAQQDELQQMTGDMGVHWKDNVSRNDMSVELITSDTNLNSPVVGIEEPVEASDWDEKHPQETPSDFGQEFILYKNMGMEHMTDMGNMAETETEEEYALHGYRDANTNGTFAPVDSTIDCSKPAST